jgi:hypothetical protein
MVIEMKGKDWSSVAHRTKTTHAIKIKFDRVNNLDEIRRYAKFGSDRSLSAIHACMKFNCPAIISPFMILRTT